MMTIHDPAVRKDFIERLRQLAPESQPQWGRLTAAQALFHLNAGFRLALGELRAEPVGDPAFWHRTGKSIALGGGPWPQGAPTSKETLASGPVSFEHERMEFLRLLEWLASKREEEAWPAHPRFGPLTGNEWARLMRAHVDHHFRQFGI